MRTHAIDRPPLALVANDAEWSVRSLESILGPAGYTIVRAYNGDQALERVKRFAPDVIILAARFPDRSGLEICRILRGDPSFRLYTPILITSSHERSRNERLEALAAGAWDYVTLPVDAKELLVRIRPFIEAKRSADQAGDIGLIDNVTGLYNRAGLLQRAAELCSDAERNGRPLACVTFTLSASKNGNSMKEVDAKLGAADVQEMLLELADTLRNSGRASDAIGRLSADEFAVIAPGTDTAGASRIAGRFLSLMKPASDSKQASGPHVKPLAAYFAVDDCSTDHIDATGLLAAAQAALESTGKKSSQVG